MANKREVHICNTCTKQYAHLCEKVRRGTPEGMNGIEWIAKPYKLNNGKKGRKLYSEFPMYIILNCDKYERDKRG